MNTIAFFNNKGGVGTTSLAYHLAWMYRDLGLRVLVADLDPQANLSTMFLDEERFEELWSTVNPERTIFGSLKPLLEGEGGIAEPHVETIEEIGLLVGDLQLSAFEDELSQQWPRCLSAEKRAFRVISGFFTIISMAAKSHGADVIIIDLGPNLGAINRAVLIAADYVVIPLAPDLFSIKGLQNLGPRLRQWREEWEERLRKKPADLEAPAGTMRPIGYVVMQHSMRGDRPVKAYSRWMAEVPKVYRASVLDELPQRIPAVDKDPHCLATLRHYRSLMPLAQTARKAMFHLKPADGAIGAHAEAVARCREDFQRLARVTAERAGISIP